MSEHASRTCGRCGKTTHHPKDITEGYCANCHDWTDEHEENVAMQNRCIHCLREQYVLNVIAVSTGSAGCAWCGRLSHKMTVAEYRHAIHLRRRADG